MKNQLLRIALFFSALFFSWHLLHAQTVAQVSTIASNGLNVPSNIRCPIATCSDASGNIYFQEYYGPIKKIDPSGTVSVVYNGDLTNLISMGSAALCVDNNGNVYMTQGASIVKITSVNTFTLIAGNPYILGYMNNNQNGKGMNARFNAIVGMCSDIFGNLYVIDNLPGALNSIIRKITPSTQRVETFLDGFTNLTAISTFDLSNIIVADVGSVRKINIFSKQITEIAGSTSIYGTSNGNGSNAQFMKIVDLKVNSNNEIFTLESYSFWEFVFMAGFSNLMPGLLDVPFRNIVRKISPTNDVTDIAGGSTGYVDAIGSDAQFNYPLGISINPGGDIFVADFGNNRIRKLTFVAPAPTPTPTYINATANICLGSTVDNPATITGNQLDIKVKNDSIAISNGIAAVGRSNNRIYVATDNGNIEKYGMIGNYIETLPAFLTNITGIAADQNNRIYAVAQDNTYPALTAVYRLDSTGYIDFGWGPTTPGILNNVSAIAIGTDGLVYVADTTTGYISVIDTVSANVTNLPYPPNTQLSYFKPVSMAFDLNNDMYLADIGLNKLLKRNKEDNNYYSLFPGIENTTLAIDGISIDNAISGVKYLSSSSNNKVYRLSDNSVLDTTGTEAGFTNQYIMSDVTSVSSPEQIVAIEEGSAGSIFIPNTGTDRIKILAVYAMRISPRLPKGLFFDEINGKISGTPLETSPYTTYTITTYSVNDSTIQTISFSVDPSSLVSNNIGNKTSPIINTTDGLSVNFYDQNGCEPLANITDNTDGNPTGNVQVSQTVSTNLPYFTTSTGTTQFVRRSTEITAQNMDSANVRIELYFTYADIVHYNANNGTQTDFSNDTTSGSMSMSILQLHTAASGAVQPITHNTTATWNTAKQVWVANFQVTEFSTFYATTQDALASFECASQEFMDFAFGCASAEYNGVTYTTDGDYTLNYINQYGCDSIIHLTVFLDNNVEINMQGWDSLQVSNSNTGNTYQWVDCDNNYAIIPGATNSLYVAADTGSYAVIITNVSCSDTSVCAYIQQVGGTAGIDGLGNVYSYSISPNPTNGMLVLKSNFSNLTLEIYNTLGTKVFSALTSDGNSVFDLTDNPTGVYMVKLITQTGNVYIERIVKQ